MSVNVGVSQSTTLEFSSKQNTSSEPKQRHQCRFRSHGVTFKNYSDRISKFNRTSSGTLEMTRSINFCDEHAIGKYPMLSEPA